MEVATEGANNPRLPGPGVQIQSIKRLHEGVWGKRQQRAGQAIGHLAGGRKGEGGGAPMLNFPRPA